MEQLSARTMKQDLHAIVAADVGHPINSWLDYLWPTSKPIVDPATNKPACRFTATVTCQREAKQTSIALEQAIKQRYGVDVRVNPHVIPPSHAHSGVIKIEAYIPLGYIK